MGIDIYLRWSGQTDSEEDAQITGFSITAGSRGYLRESYGGSPFATEVLVPESFDDRCWGDDIPADEQGMFIVSNGPQYEGFDLDRQPYITLDTLKGRLPATLATVSQRYRDDKGVEQVKQSYTDFVSLAERKLAEGHKVWVLTSY